MNKTLEQVYEWQSLFGTKTRHEVSDTPKNIDTWLAMVRQDFIVEELNEYLEGVKSDNLVEVLDALVDLQYFLNGMIFIHGLQHIFDDAFTIVHESNMSKAGPDGKPIYREDGKVLKGPNYWSPKEKLEELLNGSA